MCYKMKKISYQRLKTQFKVWKTSFFLMIQDREQWHYIAVKNLSALLREITSKHNNGFIVVFIIFESHKKYVKIKIFVML